MHESAEAKVSRQGGVCTGHPADDLKVSWTEAELEHGLFADVRAPRTPEVATRCDAYASEWHRWIVFQQRTQCKVRCYTAEVLANSHGRSQCGGRCAPVRPLLHRRDVHTCKALFREQVFESTSHNKVLEVT